MANVEAEHRRDLELVLLGVLIADREMAGSISDAAVIVCFGALEEVVREVVDCIKNGKGLPKDGQVQKWLAARGVETKNGVKAGILEKVKENGKERARDQVAKEGAMLGLSGHGKRTKAWAQNIVAKLTEIEEA